MATGSYLHHGRSIRDVHFDFQNQMIGRMDQVQTINYLRDRIDETTKLFGLKVWVEPTEDLNIVLRKTPFHVAVESYPTEALQYLGSKLEEGGLLLDALTARDAAGSTPLHYAARSKNPFNATYLLDCGSPIIRDNYERTPIDIARTWKQEVLAQKLQSAKTLQDKVHRI